MELIYDSLNNYHHYLILHLDGLYDDLQVKNFNYLLDNFIHENPKHLKLVMIKDGKNVFFNKDIEEDKRIFDDYISYSDDFIIIKNPSYLRECFDICYNLFELLKDCNKYVDVINHIDVLKYGTKRIFRVFAGRTHYLDIQNHELTQETSFGGEDYIIIRTGFTSKIDTKKLEKYLERYKFLPYFMFLKDNKIIVKNEDVFTIDSPKRIEDILVKELMEKLEYFTKADINDGFIVFTSNYRIKTVLQFFHLLKDMNYCSIKNFSDIVRIAQFKTDDHIRFLYVRLDCEKT
jgi:hypothetical protein